MNDFSLTPRLPAEPAMTLDPRRDGKGRVELGRNP